MAPLPEPINHTILAIWTAYEARTSAGQRDSNGINMGDVGEECERKLWYGLRWAVLPKLVDGPLQRRWDTGNLEEERLLDDLEAAGIQVERLDPATGAQFRIELADGWLRGKLDGKASGLPEAPKTVHVVECKSHHEKSFKELKKKGLKDGAPRHYAQCQIYMRATNLLRALYLAVNKNDDNLYAERIEYNKAFAEQLEAKVARTVRADNAPPKLFPDPDAKEAFPCNWCAAKAVCHEKAWARFNCRTCISSEFLPGGTVRCTLFGKELTYDEQQKGCPKHLYLPSLVPGEQIDADEIVRTVTYQISDGTVWVDGKS